MHLRAISIGDAVPRVDFNAVVHSVFQSALNLRLHESNQLLTLVAVNEADLPQGIRVDTHKDFSFKIFSTNEQATCRDGLLRLDILTIDLHGAQRWTCDLPALQFDSTNPAVSSAWGFIWDVLNQRQIESNADIIAKKLMESQSPDFDAKTSDAKTGVFVLRQSLAERAGNAMRGLVEATRRYDISRAESSVRALTGLGSGLTPSSDDLLVGYMAGLWCAVRSQGERVQFVKNLGDAIVRHSSRTNEISHTYLYHAAQGQVSSLLANLAEAICHGEKPEHLIEFAESAMRVGHSSGMDTVTGLLVGLVAWDSNRLLFD